MTKREAVDGVRRVEYTLVRRNRTTMELSVLPDGGVEVVAPIDATDEEIARTVLRRYQWIADRKREFSTLRPRTAPRQYVNGETFRYAGRQYLLRVSAGTMESVKLDAGCLVVTTAQSQHLARVPDLVTSWYRERARAILPKRVVECVRRFPKGKRSEPVVVIRRMAKRWGSCTKAGRIVLNVELVQAPSYAIDYVITHELCHLVHQNHGRQFWTLLERIMPDWQQRKQRLERAMM